MWPGSSSLLLLLFGGARPTLLLHGRAEAIEPLLPEAAVVGDPGVELLERLRAQRVEPPLSVGTHPDEAGFEQQPQVSRDSGLMDLQALDDVVHLLLSAPQNLDDLAARRISQRFEDI